jgi:[amino group carrier protein]-L-2-aminoadipate 6-kinase
MIVIKIGGSIVDGLHSSTISDLKKILEQEQVVFVHGGGKDVTVIGNKLGKEQKFIVSPGGVKSRYTDKETAEIYTMVMSGKINKTIIRLLLNNGINAVGISGIDGSTIQALRKKKLLVVNDKGRKMIIDGGYTGKINKINTLLIKKLLEGNFVPVISPIALSEETEFLNIDGDRAAAYIAGGLSAEKVIFITNVNGLILNDELVKEMRYDEAKKSLPIIGHGMEKKVMACIESLDMGVQEAIIASGDVENPVSSAIYHTNCTVITK